MYLATYEKQLAKAYNKAELYKIMPCELGLALVDIYHHYKRGLTVKQVISVLNIAIKEAGANYQSIQLALNETQPKGARHDA